MKTPMQRRTRKTSNDSDFIAGMCAAMKDVNSALEDHEKKISDIPKEVFSRQHGDAFLLSACRQYRTLAVTFGRLFVYYHDGCKNLAHKLNYVSFDPVPEELIQELETIQSKYQQATQYLDKLQQEKSARYKMRRQQHNDRKKIYQKCKKQGMTDADAYREIISIEESNLKPGTASYISAMNRLRMWKSRHKEELQHID